MKTSVEVAERRADGEFAGADGEVRVTELRADGEFAGAGGEVRVTEQSADGEIAGATCHKFSCLRCCCCGNL